MSWTSLVTNTHKKLHQHVKINNYIDVITLHTTGLENLKIYVSVCTKQAKNINDAIDDKLT